MGRQVVLQVEAGTVAPSPASLLLCVPATAMSRDGGPAHPDGTEEAGHLGPVLAFPLVPWFAG